MLLQISHKHSKINLLGIVFFPTKLHRNKTFQKRRFGEPLKQPPETHEERLKAIEDFYIQIKPQLLQAKRLRRELLDKSYQKVSGALTDSLRATTPEGRWQEKLRYVSRIEYYRERDLSLYGRLYDIYLIHTYDHDNLATMQSLEKLMYRQWNAGLRNIDNKILFVYNKIISLYESIIFLFKTLFQMAFELFELIKSIPAAIEYFLPGLLTLVETNLLALSTWSIYSYLPTCDEIINTFLTSGLWFVDTFYPIIILISMYVFCKLILNYRIIRIRNRYSYCWIFGMMFFQCMTESNPELLYCFLFAISTAKASKLEDSPGGRALILYRLRFRSQYQKVINLTKLIQKKLIRRNSSSNERRNMRNISATSMQVLHNKQLISVSKKSLPKKKRNKNVIPRAITPSVSNLSFFKPNYTAIVCMKFKRHSGLSRDFSKHNHDERLLDSKNNVNTFTRLRDKIILDYYFIRIFKRRKKKKHFKLFFPKSKFIPKFKTARLSLYVVEKYKNFSLSQHLLPRKFLKKQFRNKRKLRNFKPKLSRLRTYSQKVFKFNLSDSSYQRYFNPTILPNWTFLNSKLSNIWRRQIKRTCRNLVKRQKGFRKLLLINSPRKTQNVKKSSKSSPRRGLRRRRSSFTGGIEINQKDFQTSSSQVLYEKNKKSILAVVRSYEF